MKNILIINQHSKNHGDEAAGLALIRSLHKSGNTDITVSYNIRFSDERALLQYRNVKQLPPIPYRRGTARIVQFALMRLPWTISQSILLSLPQLRIDYRAIKSSDFIINAPGGVNLGLYRDYIYLWRLLCAMKLKKRCAMYSSSIGPFEEGSKFKFMAERVMKYQELLSLRDAQSCRYAKQMGLKYVESIDTAFLESPDVTLPYEITSILPSKYVVMVPNQLYLWHRNFQNIDKNRMDEFYKKLVRYFVDHKINIVLLPQIFCNDTLDDERYFNNLKHGMQNTVVIPAKYSSDVQQKIISKADFVIGARYHTIIFAINNKTSFYSLSYEHKMENTLESLNFQNNSIDLTRAIESPTSSIERIFEAYMNREQQFDQVLLGHAIAKKAAQETFEKLTRLV